MMEVLREPSRQPLLEYFPRKRVLLDMTYWFKRFKKEVEEMDAHFRFKYLKMGFWRIYWKDHYIGECYENMPQIGYDFEDYDPRLDSLEYFEEWEDHVSMVKTIKNYVEGYRDSIQNIKRRRYMVRNDDEYHQRSNNVYSQVVIK